VHYFVELQPKPTRPRLTAEFNIAHPQHLDAPLHVAARKKPLAYRAQYANNRNITFMPAIATQRALGPSTVSEEYE
jgi:hypothetical protein